MRRSALTRWSTSTTACPSGTRCRSAASTWIAYRARSWSELTRDGDTFAALDSEGPVPVPAGEVAYTTGATVLTRQLMWRQARGGLIHPETRSVFLVSESVPEAGPGLAEVVSDELGAGLRRSFGATVRCFLVDAATPRVSW